MLIITVLQRLVRKVLTVLASLLRAKVSFLSSRWDVQFARWASWLPALTCRCNGPMAIYVNSPKWGYKFHERQVIRSKYWESPTTDGQWCARQPRGNYHRSRLDLISNVQHTVFYNRITTPYCSGIIVINITYSVSFAVRTSNWDSCPTGRKG